MYRSYPLLLFYLTMLLICKCFVVVPKINSYSRLYNRLYSVDSVNYDQLLPSGLIAVYKPKNWTSNDVVTNFKIYLNKELKTFTNSRKVKVGHGGTLDPLAEGVLVLGIGGGTKLLGGYLKGSKGYQAQAQLGTATNTLDCLGNVTATADCSHITADTLRNELKTFEGDILQVPPMFSSLKKEGKRLYELAREGKNVDREPRQVTVHRLALTDCNLAGDSYQGDNNYGSFSLDIECGGGFYVRSLIADLAEKCGGVAHMTALIRTKQSMFTLEHCLAQDNWNFEDIADHIRYCSKLAGV